MEVTTEPTMAKPKGKKWGVMTGVEKVTFLVKVCIMVASSGFVFGNTFVE